MTESDWKLFKKIKEEALQKFCSNILKGISETIETQESSAHERYLQVYERVRGSDKELGQIFELLALSPVFVKLIEAKIGMGAIGQGYRGRGPRNFLHGDTMSQVAHA